MNWMVRRRKRSRRRKLLRLSLGLVVLAGGVVLTGLALPDVRETRGSVSLDSPPETVWQVLTDLDGMPRWRSDLRGLERLPDLGGRPAWKEFASGGAGEEGKLGTGTRVMQLVVADPHRRLVMRRLGGREDGSRDAVRTVDLVRRTEPAGTVVTVIEREPVGDPLTRVLTSLRLRRNPLRFLEDLTRVLSGHQRQVVLAPPPQ